jgi:Transglycosylase-like domain/Putative peptidoglycan binding domain
MSRRTARVAARAAAVRRAARMTTGLTMLAGSAATAGLLTTAGPAAASPPARTPLLYQGSVGRAVSHLQHALHITRTGHFDGRTRHAVVALQRRDGLAVDGVVGPQTWHALLGGAAPVSTTSSGGFSIPASIVECESGGNYSAVNPTSGAGGAYQILPSTWAAYGGHGLPQDAPKAEQDRIAAAIYASQGRSAWSC